MGTYYHGNSEIQGDGLQTLILMNPGYNNNNNVGYSDTPQQQQQPPTGNYMFLNPNSTGGNSLNHSGMSHAPPTQQFVGIPLSATASAAPQQQDSNHAHHSSMVHPQHDMSGIHAYMPRLQYSLYNPVDLTAARDVTRTQQGLSLSLSSQQHGYGSFGTDREMSSPALTPGHPPTISPRSGGGGGGGDDVRAHGGSSSSVSGVSNGVTGMQSVLLSSKYLKAAQELLDEVVNVGKGVKASDQLPIIPNNGNMKNGDSSPGATGDGSGSGGGGEGSSKRGVELTTAERQEIQLKKAKLVNMLDEVEQRYRQYHNQMQIVISWFEQAAGVGSAKTYTALALQTISKQFRCLKDAIMGQIRAASKSLGEENSLAGGKLEGSRLKFVDNQLRQQRALQQLGMIQHNAWRPQRGLPERSVSVLRAWLFEHFLHPYPKDSDKHMLAKQTGLTRSQVSNWFINARVRLWKPMVEEMYTEEIKEQEQNGSEDKTSKSEQNEEMATKGKAPQDKSPAENQDNLPRHNSHNTVSASAVSTSPTGSNIRNHSGFSLIGSSEMEEMTRGSPKKLRSTDMMHSVSGNALYMNMESKPETNNEQMSMKFGNDQRQARDGFTLMGSPTNYIRGFGSYPIGDIGRYGADQFTAPPYSGNGVSLTLGLPHGENLSMSGTHHQSFLSNQNIQLGRGVDISEANEFGAIDTPTSSHSATMYDNMNIQNRKRFAAQLLPDFVA